MTNPAIYGLLSKVANQERERQVAHLQLLNAAEKAHQQVVNPNSWKLRISGFFKSIALAVKIIPKRSQQKRMKIGRPVERTQS